MKKITPNIYKIDTEALGQEKIIASYLIKGDKRIAIVDPGFPSSFPIIKENIKLNGFDITNIDYILLTHFHLDHSGSTGLIIKDSPKTKVMIHRRSSFYVKNFFKIVGGARMVFGIDLMRKFGESLEVPGENVISIDNEDEIDLGGIKLKVVYTPGHSSDSVSYFEEKSASLIIGDAACIQYPALNHVMIPAGSPPIFDLVEEISTLNRLKSLHIERILLPHYGVIENSNSEFFERNINAIEKTKDGIIDMFKKNIEFQYMIEELRENIIKESGSPEDAISQFLSEIWLRMMLKTGLMGMMAYLLQYAPYPRKFAEVYR